MPPLAELRCADCAAPVSTLTEDEVVAYLAELDCWVRIANGGLRREYRFKNFYQTMTFVNAVAHMASQQKHHPAMDIGYNYCHLSYVTESVAAPTLKDFICAAKADALFQG